LIVRCTWCHEKKSVQICVHEVIRPIRVPSIYETKLIIIPLSTISCSLF
jgi:hypothetical protein